MSTSEKLFTAVLITFVVLFIGVIIWGSVDNHNNSVNACANDAQVLGVEGRYKGGCQLQTTSGVWLPEKEYLLLYATDKCP